MEDYDLQDICTYLIQIAKEAGNIILEARPNLTCSTTFTTKKNTVDIVTKTDEAVERFIHDQLSTKYPSVCFVGEESYKAGITITADPTFIVDPIDGTSNFVHGFPAVCVSIALVINKIPTIGVVYNPFFSELWSGIKGHGAFTQLHHGKIQQLPFSNTPLQGLGLACIGIEWGSDREGPNFELNLKVFTKLARTAATGGRFVNSLRCTGSAAITICRVAAGQQDAFWECGSWAWDVAAAWCILVEAGGIMVDGHPGNWKPSVDNRRYFAVRPASEGQEEFVKEFWDVIGEGRSMYEPQY